MTSSSLLHTVSLLPRFESLGSSDSGWSCLADVQGDGNKQESHYYRLFPPLMLFLRVAKHGEAVPRVGSRSVAVEAPRYFWLGYLCAALGSVSLQDVVEGLSQLPNGIPRAFGDMWSRHREVPKKGAEIPCDQSASDCCGAL